jgi:hypothetical protein
MNVRRLFDFEDLYYGDGGRDLAFRIANGLLFLFFNFFFSYVTVHFASARLWRRGAAVLLQNLTSATSAVI